MRLRSKRPAIETEPGKGVFHSTRIDRAEHSVTLSEEQWIGVICAWAIRTLDLPPALPMDCFRVYSTSTDRGSAGIEKQIVVEIKIDNAPEDADEAAPQPSEHPVNS